MEGGFCSSEAPAGGLVDEIEFTTKRGGVSRVSEVQEIGGRNTKNKKCFPKQHGQGDCSYYVCFWLLFERLALALLALNWLSTGSGLSCNYYVQYSTVVLLWRGQLQRNKDSGSQLVLGVC